MSELSEFLERKEMPNIPNDEFNIVVYANLLDKYNDTVDNYNYMQRIINSRNDTIGELRSIVSSFDTKTREWHRLLLIITREISSRFRKNEFKSVAWYNDILSEYRNMGIDAQPITTEDMYTAKAVITIDGVYRNSERDLDSIRLDIMNSIRNNINDFKVDVNEVIIEDVYDVEELSESIEG
jgi:hypothetical protein